MAFYIIKFDGRHYVNEELCQKFFAEGERSFIKQIARGDIVGTLLLDQILYPVTEAEREDIIARYQPQEQDFDAQYQKIYVIAEGPLEAEHAAALCRELTLTRSVPEDAEGIVAYRHVRFLPLRLYRSTIGYMREQMAMVRVFKYWYVALNAVNLAVDRPFIVSVH
jgi:hypothetical protein